MIAIVQVAGRGAVVRPERGQEVIAAHAQFKRHAHAGDHGGAPADGIMPHNAPAAIAPQWFETGGVGLARLSRLCGPGTRAERFMFWTASADNAYYSRFCKTEIARHISLLGSAWRVWLIDVH